LLSFVGIQYAPMFTPLKVKLAAVTRTFSIEKAKKELAYKPQINMEDAHKRTTKYFLDLRKEGKI